MVIIMIILIIIILILILTAIPIPLTHIIPSQSITNDEDQVEMDANNYIVTKGQSSIVLV